MTQETAITEAQQLLENFRQTSENFRQTSKFVREDVVIAEIERFQNLLLQLSPAEYAEMPQNYSETIKAFLTRNINDAINDIGRISGTNTGSWLDNRKADALKILNWAFTRQFLGYSDYYQFKTSLNSNVIHAYVTEANRIINDLETSGDILDPLSLRTLEKQVKGLGNRAREVAKEFQELPAIAIKDLSSAIVSATTRSLVHLAGEWQKEFRVKVDRNDLPSFVDIIYPLRDKILELSEILSAHCSSSPVSTEIDFTNILFECNDDVLSMVRRYLDNAANAGTEISISESMTLSALLVRPAARTHGQAPEYNDLLNRLTEGEKTAASFHKAATPSGGDEESNRGPNTNVSLPESVSSHQYRGFWPL